MRTNLDVYSKKERQKLASITIDAPNWIADDPIFYLSVAYGESLMRMKRIGSSMDVMINATKRLVDFMEYLGNSNNDFEIICADGRLLVPFYGSVKIECRKKEKEFKGYWNIIKSFLNEKIVMARIEK